MIALCFFIVSVLLVLSNIGLQVKLKAAQKDAEAWQAIAEAEQNRPVIWSSPTTTSDTLARYGTWH
jgi:hypothetical protein